MDWCVRGTVDRGQERGAGVKEGEDGLGFEQPIDVCVEDLGVVIASR